MPKEIDDKVWEEIKNVYLAGGETYASLALRFGIGKSTIEAKAASEKWKELKKAKSITPPPIIATPAPLLPHHRQPQEIDEVEIINDAIASLSAILSGGAEDTRGIGGIATGLCRLIELRNKLVPKTAADLADMAINLNISPTDFIHALKDKWEKRA